MPTSDQNINFARYQLIPRVLIFPFQSDSVLLLKLLPKGGKVTTWTGRFNGAGGHVERGEDLLAAARRELFEETGLQAKLSYCGMVIVDTGLISGIGLFIFRADNIKGLLTPSPEGIPEWIPFEHLQEYPLVEDVAIILDRIRRMKNDSPPFCGRSYYDGDEKLNVIFS